MVIFTSCNQKEKTVESEKPITELKSIITINDLSGDWVNLKYLHSIQKTKSPKESQGEGEYSYVTISNDTALFILGFHEGFDLKIKTFNENSFYCIGYYGDTIKMTVSNDTMVIKNKLTKDTYIRYQMRFPGSWFGSLLLNKEIFSGIYKDVDFPDHTISFTDNGKVAGFLDYISYVVQDDYADAGCQYDIVYLRKEPDDRFEYTWRFAGDTLIIYNLDCMSFDNENDICLETERGKILYRLLKK